MPSGWLRCVSQRINYSFPRDAIDHKNMSRPKRNPILSQPPLAPNEKYIKVRLDAKTTVHLKSMKNFAYWKEKYPNAEVIVE